MDYLLKVLHIAQQLDPLIKETNFYQELEKK